MIKSVMVDGAEALKLMVDGAVAWERSGLPAGYKRCKYLESTGTQYIDTGIIANPSTDESRVDYMNLKEFGETFQVPIGCATLNKQGNISVGWYWYIGRKQNFAFLNGGVPATVTDYIIDYARMVTVVLSGGFASADSAIFNSSTNNKTSDNPITIFKRNVGVVGVAAEAYAHGRVYSFSHIRSGKVMINLVPCLDNTGRPCMYDMVSKQTFYNQGTGEFLYELA